jgi:hypothetical protein
VSVFDVGSLILLLATAVGIVNERYIGIPRIIAQLLGSLLLSLIMLLISHAFGNYHFSALLEKRVDGAHLPRILLDGVLALLLFAAAFRRTSATYVSMLFSFSASRPQACLYRQRFSPHRSGACCRHSE